MNYRTFGKLNFRPSALGFGAMRLPILDGDSKKINEPEAIRMIRAAIDSGVNYIDTAYPYHGGMSEVVVGKALKDGYRQKTMLASKSPVFNIKKEEDFDNFLNEQLERLQEDHIDFYLLHALDRDRWSNVVLKFNLLDKMEKAKQEGKIRYIGFSFHDDFDAFKLIVDGYDKWDFCQIQMNYIDTENQAQLKGMEYAASKQLGIVIMEPLLGGKLANPPKQVAKVLPGDKTPVEWALDFLWNRPEVGVILSGMSTMEQVQQNIEYASRAQVGMLSQADLDMLTEARRIFLTMALVPCTKCAYCMPCPFGLNIPKTFEAYNMTASVNMEAARKVYDTLEVAADQCRACKKCEKVCPQSIEVSAVMPEVAKVFQKA